MLFYLFYLIHCASNVDLSYGYHLLRIYINTLKDQNTQEGSIFDIRVKTNVKEPVVALWRQKKNGDDGDKGSTWCSCPMKTSGKEVWHLALKKNGNPEHTRNTD